MPPNKQTPQVRTFEQDVAESMQAKQASVLRVALAEQQKQKDFFVETKTRRTHGLIYFISFLFVLVAIGTVGYVYFLSTSEKKATIPTELVQAEDFVLVDKTLAVKVDLNSRSAGIALLSKPNGVDTNLGVVNKIVPYITEAQAGGEDISRAITATEFFTLINSNVPDIFRRSLAKEVTYIQVTDNGPRSAIVVQTNDYDRTAIGLSSWEKTMFKDLEPLFGYTQKIEVKELIETITEQEVVEQEEIYDPKTKKVTLITSTTTEPVSTYEERIRFIEDEIKFENSIRKNIELRVVQGKSGKEYFVYGFPERNTLIIAGSVDVFLRIFERLPKSN